MKNYLIIVTIQKIVRSFLIRSKMYSYEINNKTTKNYKGVFKHTIKKDITIDDYRDTLFSSAEKTHSMKSIKSHNHIIKSCEITKCSLSCFDNKRYILEDGITILAYGHFRLRRETTYHKKTSHVTGYLVILTYVF